jgi:hypothetical protein
MKIIITLFIGLTILSCRKDEVILINLPIEEIEQPKEQFIDAFSNYTAEQEITINSHPEGDGPVYSITQKFNYKMYPSVEQGGNFLYKITKYSQYLYDNNPYTISGTEIMGYYRYDFKNKISYHYNSIEDQNPRIVLDFNVNIGDTIILDYNSYANTPIQFVVEEVGNELIDEILLPKISGYYIRNYELPNQTNYHTSITPIFPNLFFIDNNFNYYLHHDWQHSNFNYTYAGGDTFAEFYKYTLKNIYNEFYDSDITFDRWGQY